jgi:hypothetical protein
MYISSYLIIYVFYWVIGSTIGLSLLASLFLGIYQLFEPRPRIERWEKKVTPSVDTEWTMSPAMHDKLQKDLRTKQPWRRTNS